MYEYRAEVLRVVDGDTLDLRIDLGFKIDVRIRVRLYGIDTPETYGVPKGSPEYVLGKAATQFVLDWIRGWPVTPRGSKDVGGFPSALVIRTTDANSLNFGTGKYGRWIAEIYRDIAGTRDPISLNDALVAAGHATEVSY